MDLNRRIRFVYRVNGFGDFCYLSIHRSECLLDIGERSPRVVIEGDFPKTVFKS